MAKKLTFKQAVKACKAGKWKRVARSFPACVGKKVKGK